MRAARARYVATFVATAAAAVGSLLGSVGSAQAAGTPSWEPDPNAVAGIVFFDGSGQQVTSGSTSGSMAAYAVATNTIHQGDNAAVLYAALPNTSEPTADWSREALSGASAYPVSGAPSGIGSGPAVTGTAQDESLATFASHFPSSSGIYQIRMTTENSAGSGVQSTSYAAADVLISGSNWTEIYPKNATGGSSTLHNSAKPKLSGKHKVGKTEKCSHGSWSPKPSSYSYQWYKGSSKIKGATKSSLKLTKSLKGKSIHCKVTAHKSGFSTASASSKSVKVTG